MEIQSLAEISCEIGAVDLMEISPKRFTGEAAHLGLKPGYAIDLEEAKPDGTYSGLSKSEDIASASKIVDLDAPVLLTGRTLTSTESARINARRTNRLEYLRNSCRVYKFLHEAPWTATS